MKATGIVEITPPTNLKENNKIIQKFNKQLIILFEDWWKKQTMCTGQKLDFYYRYKKTFRFENYLDNIQRNIRIYTTRLRLSSHSLLVEILRYRNIKREERICNICNLKEIGDEEHYLAQCKNNKIREIRQNFMDEIKSKVPQLMGFDDRNLMEYCMSMKDINTQKTQPFLYKGCY